MGAGAIKYSRKDAKAAYPSSPGTTILLKNSYKKQNRVTYVCKKNVFSVMFSKGLFQTERKKSWTLLFYQGAD